MVKTKKNVRSPWTAVLIFALTICTIILASLLLQRPSGQQEPFIRLSSDIKVILSSFNEIDEKWVYTEYCTGMSSPYRQGEASTCTVKIYGKLSNNSDDLFASYRNIISNNKSFQEITIPGNNTPTTDSNVRNTSLKYRYNLLPESNCELIIYSDENVSGAFYCTSQADGFYFNRIDR